MSLLLDGGCFVGQPMERGRPQAPEDLIRYFDEYEVQAGVVGSYRCLYQDLLAGNRELAALAQRHPERIIPLAIIHPCRYDQSLPDLLRWLKDSLGFRMIGLFSLPAYYPLVWNSPVMEEIGGAAEELGLILQAGLKDEQELSALALVWGRLKTPVMVRWMGGHRYRMVAHECAAARACPNFYFDAGNLCSTGALAHLARTMGAQRLFFASNWPHNLPAPPHAMLEAAQLSPEERAWIAGGTLQKLLGRAEIRAGVVFASGRRRQQWERIKSWPKVDIHWHPDHWNLGEPELDWPAQTKVWQEYHCESVVLFSIQALNYDLESGNRLTAKLVEQDPRCFGLIVVNPLQLPESLKQIEQYAGHPRFIGLKTIQNNYGLGLDDPLYEPLLREAERRGLPLLAHLTGMEGAARRHPEVRFVATHGNWGRTQRLWALPNVCFDFSTSHAWADETQLERFIRAVGPERVLFGSDGQLVAPAWSLSKLVDCRLDDAELDLILRRNAGRVFTKLGIAA
ncbi:MAG: amidohydrolase family protein [Chloroflexi bacterium]|nr:amidohydrolase family protein [Chloroflexota bacterium]